MLIIPQMVQAKLKVVATLPIFASLAQEIGGEYVEVETLARASMDPHYVDAKPTYVSKIARADALIFGGLGLESGWLPPLVQQSGNKKILKGQSGHIDMSVGILILQIPGSGITRSMGDIHPEGNPHFWIDPYNLKIMALNLKERFSNLDKNHASYFYERYQKYQILMDDKLNQLRKEIKKLKGKKIITYHKSFVYFAKRFHMTVVDEVEPLPGIPPSARRIPELLKVIQSEGVDLLLMADYYPWKIPNKLSKESKVPLVRVPITTDTKVTHTVDWIGKVITEMVRILEL